MIPTKHNYRLQVLNGTIEQTAGGLRKKDLKRNKAGKIVSKRASDIGKKNYAKTIGPWNKVIKSARGELGLEGFHPITKRSKLYKKARAKYKSKSGKKNKSKK
jgi:hypothetical protein